MKAKGQKFDLASHQPEDRRYKWCADWYGKFSLDDAVDPKGPNRGRTRVLRGGSYFAPASIVRSASRGRFEPSHLDDTQGLRLTISVPWVTP